MAEPEPSALDVSVEVQQPMRIPTAFKVGDKVECAQHRAARCCQLPPRTATPSSSGTPARAPPADASVAVGRRRMRPVRWYDDLYWLGTVDKINDDGTASVAIENGDTEPQVPLDELHLLPFSRKAVFEGPEVLVFDGHSLVPGEGEAGPIVGVRLLSFRSSPHLYQSGCLLNPDDGSLLWAPIAFEIIQAMSTTMAFLHRRTQRVAAAAGAGGAGASLTGPPYDSAWLGGGSGSCPQTCRNLFREYLRRIDVVELSPEVMRVAQQHFGLTEDESVKCHVADGAVFLAEQPANSYDLVAIDAADHDASDEGPYMEAPPAGLYSEEFLRDVLWTRLRPGGFIAVNAIGRREQYVEYGRRLKACGFWPIYIFAIDPNMVFFGELTVKYC